MTRAILRAAEAPSRPEPTVLGRGIVRVGHMRRYSEIASVLGRYAFVDVVRHKPHDQIVPYA